jgi:hypothetical protein
MFRLQFFSEKPLQRSDIQTLGMGFASFLGNNGVTSRFKAKGITMGAILSPSVDTVSKLRQDFGSPQIDNPIAKADGLTLEEALELAACLKDAGYGPIEVVHEAAHCSVVWKK